MLLSVIIVNYNVKYFLEQCLCSVQKAIDELSIVSRQWNAEVIVMDNNSADDSVGYLQPLFPGVQFISNTENVGFARANNLALQRATGKYILFLNPDTIVPEDGLLKCVRFMEDHSDAGAMGVYMMDGSGEFLKESKRGFPSPWVSFCKMSGLTRLFPSSKFFAGYYQGHLSNDQLHEVAVLPGAYMLVRKEVLDKTGGFDEQFFMYAEDIDLSYRIQQAGYKNYYFPGCKIIHFKGESTPKDSRYVKLFYKAMIQFVRKHFRGRTSGLYIGLLRLIILLQTSWIAIVGRKKTIPANSIASQELLLVGEKELINTLLQQLAQYKIQLLVYGKEEVGQLATLSNNREHTVVIFCESTALPFNEIIELLQRLENKRTFGIHSSRSCSVVWSASRNINGNILVVK